MFLDVINGVRASAHRAVVVICIVECAPSVRVMVPGSVVVVVMTFATFTFSIFTLLLRLVLGQV